MFDNYNNNNTLSDLLALSEDHYVMKNLFPLTSRDIVGFTAIGVMNIFAVAGGIGGGGIMIPFMMIFLQMPIEQCIPLANFFGLLSAFTRFVYNYNENHPYRPWRKIIDYEIVTLTMQMVYLGSVIGVLIGERLNQLTLVILLQIVLAYTLYKTL